MVHGKTEAAPGPVPPITITGLRDHFSGALQGPAGPDEELDTDGPVADAAGSLGQRLPHDLQSRFETSLGTDLSTVRLHTGASSQAAAKSVGARAYTIGQDIHFGPGHFDPSSTAGQALIAHEVAHTVQQRGAAPARQNKLEVSSSGDALEAEADRAASAMLGGRPISLTGGAAAMVARKPEGDGSHVDLKEDTVRPSKALSDADREKLQAISKKVASVKSAYSAAVGAMSKYGSQFSGKLSGLQGAMTDALNTYEQARTNVNLILDKAAKVAAVRDAVLSEIASAALGGLMSHIPNIQSGFSETELKVTEGFAGFNKGFELFEINMSTSNAEAGDFLDEGKGMLEGASKGAGDALNDGPGTPSAPGAEGGGSPSWASELSIVQAAKDLATAGAKLVGPLSKLAALGPVLGQAEAKVQAMFDANATVGRSIADLESGAAALHGAVGGIKAVGGSATTALAAIDAAMADVKGSAPASVDDAEREIWVRWAGNLSVHDSDLLDDDTVENHLQAMGIWDKLGVDRGSYTSQDDELRAIVSSKAQEILMAHRGESYDLHGEGAITVGQQRVPVVYENPNETTSHFRATIVGSQATGEVPDEVLNRGDTRAAAEYLIGKGGVAVVMRVVEDLTRSEDDD